MPEKGATVEPGVSDYVFSICVTSKAMAGTTNGFIPLADRGMRSNHREAHLLRVGVEPTDQAQKAPEEGQTGTTGSARHAK